MIYLKTIFSAPNEIKYLKLNLVEAMPYVDKFIVCEFNRTHIGTAREWIFEKYWGEFTAEEKAKIIYIKGDISALTKQSTTDNRIIHDLNEKTIRGYFASQIKLEAKDIIFSVDADEIIFGVEYPKIISSLNWWRPALKLPLYQFYYKINYLWENNKFIAPTVCFAKYYKKKYPANWRYAGWLYKKYAGCHFSWCLNTEEMIEKLSYYGHHQDYKHLADKNILEAAVKNKNYPFDPKVDFRLRVLDLEKDKKYFPASIYKMLDKFNNLIATG